ncbi:MAG: HAD family hydrolase, partial [Promethearchaeota archaeon]
AIKAIIFDLGGVVVNLDFSIFYNSIIGQSPLNKPQTPIILEFFRQSDIYHQGLIRDADFYQMACDLLQVCELSQESFFNAFNSIISGFNPKVVDLLEELSKIGKFKLLCLSNVNSSHWDYLLKKNWGFIKYFDELVLSHEIHMTKPDKNIFEYTIKKAKCKPDEIVFVDDGLNNIRSAREIGIIGIEFTNVKDLREDFKKLYILSD